MDSVAAEHLDVAARVRATSTPRARVLEQGPPRRALGHLEVGVATALTYGLRIADGLEAAQRGDGDRRGGRRRAAVGGRRGGLRLARARRRAAARGLRRPTRAFAVADRHRRPFLAFMATNIQRPVHLGDRRARRGAGPLRAAAAPRLRRRRRLPPADRRRHRALPRLARRARRPRAACLPDAHGDLDHPLAQAGARPLGRRPGRGRRARRGDARDEPPHGQPLGRVGLAGTSPRACARCAASTRRPSPLLEAARARSSSTAGRAYFELWLLPDLARALAELGRVEEAREHVDALPRDRRRRRGLARAGGHVGVADAVVLAPEGEPDAAERAFAAALEVLARHGWPARRPTRCTSGAARSALPGAARRGGRALPRLRRGAALARPRRGRPPGAALTPLGVLLRGSPKVQGPGQGGSPMCGARGVEEIAPMPTPTPHLTSRERDVLLCEGLPVRTVAVRLLMPVGEVLEYRHRLRVQGLRGLSRGSNRRGRTRSDSPSMAESVAASGRCGRSRDCGVRGTDRHTRSARAGSPPPRWTNSTRTTGEDRDHSSTRRCRRRQRRRRSNRSPTRRLTPARRPGASNAASSRPPGASRDPPAAGRARARAGTGRRATARTAPKRRSPRSAVSSAREALDDPPSRSLTRAPAAARRPPASTSGPRSCRAPR